MIFRTRCEVAPHSDLTTRRRIMAIVSQNTWVLSMDQADQPRSKPGRAAAQRREWKIASISLVVASAVLVIAVLVANLQSPRVALELLISLISARLSLPYCWPT